MHGPDPTALPVVLSPDPPFTAAGSPWPSWDEVLTIRRRSEPSGSTQWPSPSWDELLGSR